VGRLRGRFRRRTAEARHALIEDAAAYGGENQTDARFALMLLYNREKRYDEALSSSPRCARTIRATAWCGSKADPRRSAPAARPTPSGS
jgi:hypothetical protein